MGPSRPGVLALQSVPIDESEATYGASLCVFNYRQEIGALEWVCARKLAVATIFATVVTLEFPISDKISTPVSLKRAAVE